MISMQLYVCILSSIQLISMLFDYLILSGLDFDTLTYASLKKSIIDQNKALWYLQRNVPKISKKYINIGFPNGPVFRNFHT